MRRWVATGSGVSGKYRSIIILFEQTDLKLRSKTTWPPGPVEFTHLVQILQFPVAQMSFIPTVSLSSAEVSSKYVDM